MDDWKRSGPLCPGESVNIYTEVYRVLGAQAGNWLNDPNTRFAGLTPAQVIASGQEFWVRDVLRSILSGALS